MKTTKFHVSNYGAFSEGIPCDIDGFCYTTIKGWMGANVDWGTDTPPRAARLDWAREKAREAREAIRLADRAIAQWRKASA